MRALASKAQVTSPRSPEGDWAYSWHIEWLHYYPERRNEMTADSLAHAAGAATTWTGPDGNVYKIRPITISDLADLEAWNKSEKLRILLENTVGMDKDTRAAAIVSLCNTDANMDGLSAGLSSTTGVRFLLWSVLHKSHPELTLDKVGRLITLDNFDEVSTIIQMTGGSVEEDDSPPVKAARD